MRDETTEAVSKMVGEIVAALDGRVLGIWLYGSVVLKDFQLCWSDIDFVALTDCVIAEEQAERLLMLRQGLSERENGNPYYRSFEGIIANLEEYRTGTFRRLVYWGTSGQRITDTFAHDAFSKYELAVCGQPVYGGRKWPFPKPERAELVQAVRSHYETIRKYAVRTDSNLYACGWLLDIARCIHTLRYGDVIPRRRQDCGQWRKTFSVMINRFAGPSKSGKIRFFTRRSRRPNNGWPGWAPWCRSMRTCWKKN